MTMQPIKRLTATLLLTILGSVVTSQNSVAQIANQNTVEGYNVLPPSLLSGEDSSPNIMIVLDNSGSMAWDVSNSRCPTTPSTTGFGCAGHQDSRSYIVRSAINNFLDSQIGNANVGLMVYDYYWRDNRGSLRSSVKPLDQAHNTFLQARLRTEDVGRNNRTVIRSSGGTPIEATLLEAGGYFAGNLRAAQNDSGEPIQYIPDQACSADTVVILLTDGEPNSAPRASSPYDSDARCTGRGGTGEPHITCSARAAGLLQTNFGIKTYVISFGDSNPAIEHGADAIALAGGGRDTAFPASDEEGVRKAFEEIFGDIFQQASTTSSGSTLASNATGTGVSIVPSFVPKAISDDELEENEVYWTGNLQSFWVDRFGYTRQDDHRPNNTQIAFDEQQDTAFEFETDPDDNKLKVKLYDVNPEDGERTPHAGFEDINTLQPLWDVSEQLGTLHPILTPTQLSNEGQRNRYNKTIVKHRRYNRLPSINNGARHILTWIDKNNDGQVNDDEQDMQFRWRYNNNYTNHITPDDRHFILGLNDPSIRNSEKNRTARNIIDFIRGNEYLNETRFRPATPSFGNYRNRTLNRGTANEKRLLMGDIVHSNALQVGVRNAGYDILYGDQDYKAFKQASATKRKMVYVGANDGMLHAFNAGFYDSATSTYTKRGSNRETAFDFGEEIWAYVPQAALPHLRFLASEDYNLGQHVYFVDGATQAFDVKIFNNDTDHPGGWGTILVASMRYGGMNHDIDLDRDGRYNDNKTLTSSHIIFDITNPEKAPKLLAEVTHPELGAASSTPTVVYQGRNGTNDWFLVFGSGPNDIKTATSNRTARLFKYDLNQLEFVTDNGFNNGKLLTNISNNSFVGDMAAIDWENDRETDAVYFGTVEGTPDNPSGDLRRLNVRTNSITQLINTGEPTPLAPLLLRDTNDENWVISYSGRTHAEQDWNYQSSTWMYAIREKFKAGANFGETDVDDTLQLNTSNEISNRLVDVTNWMVTVELKDQNGNITQVGGLLERGNTGNRTPVPIPNNVNLSGSATPVTTSPQLADLILSDDNSYRGWRRELLFPVTAPNERFRQSPFRVPSIDALAFNTYIPPTEQCSTEGNGITYAFSFVTGIAYYDPGFPEFNGVLGNSDSNVKGAPTGKILVDTDTKNSGNLTRLILRDPGDGNGTKPPPPCSDTVSAGTRGTSGNTNTLALKIPPCTDASRKSWTEIDLSEL